jgi:NAD(P)-dependent dehydrogenase (short-subunit alcohol dehydrogenase family)
MDLFARIRVQKVERLSNAQLQLDAAPTEENADVDGGDNGREVEGDTNNTQQNSDPQEQSGEESIDEENESPEGPQNYSDPETRQARYFIFATLIIYVALVVLWLLSRMIFPPYTHDIAVVEAQNFFGTTGSSKEAPMKGITVVISETKSALGSTIEDRFAQLGATVASVEDGIDCNDLNSVAKSVDSILGKSKNKIDFLVHTGNLCLNHKTIESMATKQMTVQGYDALFGGNYLSAFLVTQKVLPKLERSKFGTIVQFTSKASYLADGSQLEMEIETSVGVLLRHATNYCLATLYLPVQFVLESAVGKILRMGNKAVQLYDESQEVLQDLESSTASEVALNYLSKHYKTYLIALLNMPLTFAAVKLSEIIRHKSLARAYPNIRTIEISNGWIGFGEQGADDLFGRIFHEEQDSQSSHFALTEIDEDLQERVYEWSQNAVWKWAGSPVLPPVTEMVLGKPPSKQVMDRSEQQSPITGAKLLSAASTGALVVLAMNAKALMHRSE